MYVVCGYTLLLDARLIWCLFPFRIAILGIGVTEAGLVHKDTPVMKDLYQLLCILATLPPRKEPLIVLDMDNVPNNGTLIQSYMEAHAHADKDKGDIDVSTFSRSTMTTFLAKHVVFCDTMVDRITSERPGSHGMVPRCEPLPDKALVVFDEHGVMPSALLQHPGVVCRSKREQFELDIALKLRIANGTHTAIAHALALLGHVQTNVLHDTGGGSVFIKYLDALVEEQIIMAYEKGSTQKEEAELVWNDWRRRLMHPHFGLSSFFITQNGTAKGGIRWGPTVVDLILNQECRRSSSRIASPQISFALAYAILLRWLTPVPAAAVDDDEIVLKQTDKGIYRGWLEGKVNRTTTTSLDMDDAAAASVAVTVVEYADGLRYDLTRGWYEYKCPIPELVSHLLQCAKFNSLQPSDCIPAVETYFLSEQGGNLGAIAHCASLTGLTHATAVLYARLLAGDGLWTLFQELDHGGAFKGGIGFTTPCNSLGLPPSSSSPLHGVSP